eukprot:9524243-Ditylum_brightwellii.AAC.1
MKHYRKLTNQRDMENEKEAMDIAKICHEDVLLHQYEHLCDIIRSGDPDKLSYNSVGEIIR